MGLGRRFNLTEEELVGYYLKNWIPVNPLKEWDYGMLIEQYLYAENSTPWEMFDENNLNLPWHPVVTTQGKVVHAEKVLYVFTKLSNVGKTKNSESKQKMRVAGQGTWHGNTPQRPVCDRNGKVIGKKRNLTFWSKEETMGQWTMTEFLIDPAANGMNVLGIDCNDYVLCRIKRDDSKSSIEGKILTHKRNRAAEDACGYDQQSFGKKMKSSATTAAYSPIESACCSSITTNVRVEELNQTWISTNFPEFPCVGMMMTEASANATDASPGDDNIGGCYVPLLMTNDGGEPDCTNTFSFPEDDITNPDLCYDIDADTLFEVLDSRIPS